MAKTFDVVEYVVLDCGEEHITFCSTEYEIQAAVAKLINEYGVPSYEICIYPVGEDVEFKLLQEASIHPEDVEIEEQLF